MTHKFEITDESVLSSVKVHRNTVEFSGKKKKVITKTLVHFSMTAIYSISTVDNN